MKKISLIIIFFILLFGNTFANSIDFYGEKLDEWNLDSSNVNLIQNKINKIQDNYGLNSDIIILGKQDRQNCYLDNNFDSCVQKNYNYNSDLIITLKMKSDISDVGDIRSLVKNNENPIFHSYDTKIIQDNIIYNFKSGNFKKGLLEYYDYLNVFLNNECKKIYNTNVKLGGLEKNKDCNLLVLSNIQKENSIKTSEYEKNQAFKRNIYLISFILLIIFSFIIIRYYYISHFKSLLKDIKFKIIDFSKNETFAIDKDEILKKLDIIESKAQEYLGNIDKNPFKVKNQYKKLNKIYEEILKQIEYSIKNYNSQKELNDKIDDLKNIDL